MITYIYTYICIYIDVYMYIYIWSNPAILPLQTSLPPKKFKAHIHTNKSMHIYTQICAYTPPLPKQTSAHHLSKNIFRKRATNYWALLQKMTYNDKASHGSSPPCSGPHLSLNKSWHIHIHVHTHIHTRKHIRKHAHYRHIHAHMRT